MTARPRSIADPSYTTPTSHILSPFAKDLFILRFGACNDCTSGVTFAPRMSPSPGHTLRAAFLRLTRLLGLVFACIAAGALAGPWQTPAPSPCADAQVVAVPAHEVPAVERHEPAPAPSEES